MATKRAGKVGAATIAIADKQIEVARLPTVIHYLLDNPFLTVAGSLSIIIGMFFVVGVLFNAFQTMPFSTNKQVDAKIEKAADSLHTEVEAVKKDSAAQNALILQKLDSSSAIIGAKLDANTTVQNEHYQELKTATSTLADKVDRLSGDVSELKGGQRRESEEINRRPHSNNGY